jgi:hypothetical protein
MTTRALPQDVVEGVSTRLGEMLERELARTATSIVSDVREALGEMEVPAAESVFRTPLPLQRAVTAVRRGDRQVAILRNLLAGAASLGARAALFVVRPEHALLWDAAGFEEEESAGGALSGKTLPLDDPALRQAIVDRESTYATPGSGNARPEFGQDSRPESALIPLCVQGRVVALVYADPAAHDDGLDFAGLEILADVTSLAVERLAIARGAQGGSADSGHLSGPVATSSGPAFGESTAASAPDAGRSAPADHTTTPPDTRSARPAERETGESAPAAPSADESFGFDLAPEPKSPSQPSQPPSATGLRPDATEGALIDKDASSEETSPEIEDARRFARLLVEEICLYHGTRVEEGRENQDLLERLADEIERARTMYEQRIEEDVRNRGDFFGEALVKILAAGDRAALA